MTETEKACSKNQPRTQEDFAKLEAEVTAELEEVFGGEGEAEPRFRSKWYVAGIYPFRRISFECPGCSRWLSVKASHSGRLGFCPSCALTLSTPDAVADLPATIVSTAKEIPALPARRIPQPRQPIPAGTEASSRSEHSPELKRFGSIEEEGDWGIQAEKSLIPLRVVTRFQSLAPWGAILGLLVAAGFVGKAFMGFENKTDAEPIPSLHPVKGAPAPQHGSELWVVLDSLSTAETPEELNSMVRNSGNMLPKMQAFYAAHPEITLPHRFERARPGLKIYKRGTQRFGRFEGRCDGRPVMFSFESTTNGWRLDWESLIGYSENDWATFVDERPDTAQSFRVIAKISTDDLIEYNRQRYVCLHVTDHFETRDAFMLVEKHSLPARKLAKFFKQQSSGSSPRTWISTVLKPAEDSDELLELVDMSSSWLAP